MPKILIGVLIGLILGAAAVFFFFVGVPRAAKAPGQPIKPPDASAPGGTAQIVLRQDFFNEVLGAVFKNMDPPSFPLGGAIGQNISATGGPEYAAFQAPAKCEGKITVLPEGSGVTTGVRFQNNRISAPIAFRGSYDSPVGCLDFTGWAQANLELRFDAGQQTLFGRLDVETVNLDGVNPVLSGFVTPIVQNTLNNRVNPIQILSGRQISVDVPVASAGGNLRAQVSDMRAEFKDDALNLYVVYDVSGARTQ
jgi:hypothetical protein